MLDRLAGLDLVNDSRYAELWLKSRIRRGNKGPRILRALLQAKGIDRKTAEAALRTILTPEAETGLLMRCLEKAGPADRNKVKRFLKSEGFSAAAIEAYSDTEEG